MEDYGGTIPGRSNTVFMNDGASGFYGGTFTSSSGGAASVAASVAATAGVKSVAEEVVTGITSIITSVTTEETVKKKEEREKIKAIDVSALPPDDEVRFPIDPYAFCPQGLVLKEYVAPGNGRNGGIIKWEISGTGIAIFEWNEDYMFGSHYHVMLPISNNKHTGEHYLPGMLVPEPWKTIYFGD